MTSVSDAFARTINYLRISVTDRCNLRCIYCMPPGGVEWMPHSQVLSYEEILRVVEVGAELGLTKVRVTGGEPTVRPGIVDFVGMLSGVPAVDDISMTTNGIRLTRLAASLKEAGLKRVNISLDTLKPERFKAITRVGDLEDVFEGIEAAQKAGLAPIKINAVVMQDINDDEVADLARLSVEWDLHVRFIELMPFTDVHCSLGQGEVKATFVPSQRVMEEVENSLGKLEVAKPPLGNGPARYYRLPGARGTVGFISPWSQEHFCLGCNRLRLTSQGKLRPCLLTDLETDLRSALRAGASRQELKELILDTARIKPEGHSLARGVRPRKRTMTQIGG